MITVETTTGRKVTREPYEKRPRVEFNQWTVKQEGRVVGYLAKATETNPGPHRLCLITDVTDLPQVMSAVEKETGQQLAGHTKPPEFVPEEEIDDDDDADS